MNFASFFLCMALIMSSMLQCNACASHAPPQVPQSFIGTVIQGCTPKVITAVTQIVPDPTKCNLPLAPGGCNLCGLRLYKPEIAGKFLVQPIYNDLNTANAAHIQASECKCSEGCYFHRSSITQFGIEPLPTSIGGTVGSFSEPFACFSGISMPGTASKSGTYTFLIWCENDGGCPNDVVARYSFTIRFELLSPNRPATTSNFVPKITSLPPTKCLLTELSRSTANFIRGRGGKPPRTTAPTTTIASGRKQCSPCTVGSDCRSQICFRQKCIRDRSNGAKRRCGLPIGPDVGGGSNSGSGNNCSAAQRVSTCVSACLSSY